MWDNDLPSGVTVSIARVARAVLARLMMRRAQPKGPIVLDRLRQMPFGPTLAKCLFALDLVKMTVPLTVSSR